MAVIHGQASVSILMITSNMKCGDLIYIDQKRKKEPNSAFSPLVILIWLFLAVPHLMLGQHMTTGWLRCLGIHSDFRRKLIEFLSPNSFNNGSQALRMRQVPD